MTSHTPLWIRAVCNLARGLLAVTTLLVAFVAGAFVIVPLAIFALPLVAILGGLLVLIVLAATGSMAEDWQAARMRRRAGSAAPEHSASEVTLRERLSRSGRGHPPPDGHDADSITVSGVPCTPPV